MAVAILFLVNDIGWAAPADSFNSLQTSATLAAQSGFKPFSDQQLDLKTSANIIYAAGAIRDLLSSGSLRQSHIMNLNKLFAGGVVEIDPDIRQAVLRSGKTYNYAIFNFGKTRKSINVLFIKDRAGLTDDELSELGIRKGEARHLACPGLDGVWFLDAAKPSSHIYFSLVAEKGSSLDKGLKDLLLRLDAELKANGMMGDSIVKETVFISDYSHKAGCREIIDRHYGRAPPATSYIIQPPLGGGIVSIEVMAVKGARVERHENVSVFEENGARWAYVAGIEPDDPGDSTYEEKALNCFNKLKTALTSAGFEPEDIVRTWLYVSEILKIDEIGGQRYQQLNDARDHFFATADGGRPIRFRSKLPVASTGIGMLGGSLVFECVAVSKAPAIEITPLKNPRQTNPYDYSSGVLVKGAREKKAPPKFSRGMLVSTPGYKTVFVSGTASVIGEEVVNKGDVEAQTRTTIENIELVLNEAGLTLRDLLQPRVYVKNREDYDKVRAIVEERCMGFPCLYVIGDVCRADWLVEIESAAMRAESHGLPVTVKDVVAAKPVEQNVASVDPVARYQRALKELTEFGQEGLLADWTSLTEEEKNNLLASIERVDWKEVARLVNIIDKEKQAEPDFEEITVVERTSKAASTGEEALRWGAGADKAKFAGILVAGGTGSGLKEIMREDQPKGTLKATPLSGQELYRALILKTMAASRSHGHTKMYPFVFMLSDQTDEATIRFMTALPEWNDIKDRVIFANQKVLPGIDRKTMNAFLGKRDRINLGGAGHGDAFDYILNPDAHAKGLVWSDANSAFVEREVVEWLEGLGVEYAQYLNVDNLLSPLADRYFLGSHILSRDPAKERLGRAHISLGMIRKTQWDDKRHTYLDRLGNVAVVNGEKESFNYDTSSDRMNASAWGDPSIRLVTIRSLAGSAPIEFEPIMGKTDKDKDGRTREIVKFERKSDVKKRYGIELGYERDDVFASIKKPDTKAKVETPGTAKRLQSEHWKKLASQALGGIRIPESTVVELPWDADYLSPEALKERLSAINFSSRLREGVGLLVSPDFSSIQEIENPTVVNISPDAVTGTASVAAKPVEQNTAVGREASASDIKSRIIAIAPQINRSGLEKFMSGDPSFKGAREMGWTPEKLYEYLQAIDRSGGLPANKFVEIVSEPERAYIMAVDADGGRHFGMNLGYRRFTADASIESAPYNILHENIHVVTARAYFEWTDNRYNVETEAYARYAEILQRYTKRCEEVSKDIFIDADLLEEIATDAIAASMSDANVASAWYAFEKTRWENVGLYHKERNDEYLDYLRRSIICSAVAGLASMPEAKSAELRAIAGNYDRAARAIINNGDLHEGLLRIFSEFYRLFNTGNPVGIGAIDEMRRSHAARSYGDGADKSNQVRDGRLPAEDGDQKGAVSGSVQEADEAGRRAIFDWSVGAGELYNRIISYDRVWVDRLAGTIMDHAKRYNRSSREYVGTILYYALENACTNAGAITAGIVLPAMVSIRVELADDELVLTIRNPSADPLPPIIRNKTFNRDTTVINVPRAQLGRASEHGLGVSYITSSFVALCSNALRDTMLRPTIGWYQSGGGRGRNFNISFVLRLPLGTPGVGAAATKPIEQNVEGPADTLEAGTRRVTLGRVLKGTRNRAGFGYATGLYFEDEDRYFRELMIGYVGSQDFTTEQSEAIVNALVRIREGSLKLRPELFSPEDAYKILAYMPFDAATFIAKVKAEHERYLSRKVSDGKRLFSDKDIFTLLFRKLIPLSWIEELMASGLSKTEAMRIVISWTNPKKMWFEVLRPIRDELVESGLSKNNATKIVTRWSNPKETWEEVLKPIRDELVDSGLSKSDAIFIITAWSDPKETWHEVLKPIRDELVDSGLSRHDAIKITLRWSDPKKTWDEVMRPVRDELVASGLSKSAATHIVITWADPGKVWVGVLKPIRDELVGSGLSITEATRIVTRWSDPKKMWEEALRPVTEDLIASGLSRYDSLRVVLKWSDPKKTWEETLRPVRDELVDSGLSKSDATSLVIGWSADIKKRWDEIMKPVRDELVASGLPKSYATRVVTRWSDPKKTWGEVLRPIRDELVDSGLSKTDATCIVITKSEPKKAWTEVLRPVRDEIMGWGLSKRDATNLVITWSDPKARLKAANDTVPLLMPVLGKTEAQTRRYIITNSYRTLAAELKDRFGQSEDDIIRLTAALKAYYDKHGGEEDGLSADLAGPSSRGTARAAEAGGGFAGSRVRELTGGKEETADGAVSSCEADELTAQEKALGVFTRPIKIFRGIVVEPSHIVDDGVREAIDILFRKGYTPFDSHYGFTRDHAAPISDRLSYIDLYDIVDDVLRKRLEEMFGCIITVIGGQGKTMVSIDASGMSVEEVRGRWIDMANEFPEKTRTAESLGRITNEPFRLAFLQIYIGDSHFLGEASSRAKPDAPDISEGGASSGEGPANDRLWRLFKDGGDGDPEAADRDVTAPAPQENPSPLARAKTVKSDKVWRVVEDEIKSRCRAVSDKLYAWYYYDRTTIWSMINHRLPSDIGVRAYGIEFWISRLRSSIAKLDLLSRHLNLYHLKAAREDVNLMYLDGMIEATAVVKSKENLFEEKDRERLLELAALFRGMLRYLENVKGPLEGVLAGVNGAGSIEELDRIATGALNEVAKTAQAIRWRAPLYDLATTMRLYRQNELTHNLRIKGERSDKAEKVDFFKLRASIANLSPADLAVFIDYAKTVLAETRRGRPEKEIDEWIGSDIEFGREYLANSYEPAMEVLQKIAGLETTGNKNHYAPEEIAEIGSKERLVAHGTFNWSRQSSPLDCAGALLNIMMQGMVRPGMLNQTYIGWLNDQYYDRFSSSSYYGPFWVVFRHPGLAHLNFDKTISREEHGLYLVPSGKDVAYLVEGLKEAVRIGLMSEWDADWAAQRIATYDEFVASYRKGELMPMLKRGDPFSRRRVMRDGGFTEPDRQSAEDPASPNAGKSFDEYTAWGDGPDTAKTTGTGPAASKPETQSAAEPAKPYAASAKSGMGRKILSELVRKPVGFDWQKEARALPDLSGLYLGRTDVNGVIVFFPIPYFGFKWQILGFREAGWEAYVVEDGVRNGIFQLTVKLTKEGSDPILRTFQIGPGIRTLRGCDIKKGSVATTLDIDDRAGASALGELLADPDRFKMDTGSLGIHSRLRRLIGLRLGQTDVSGGIRITPFPYYSFSWAALGHRGDGWDAVITDSGMHFGIPQFTVRFTKEGNEPLTKTYQIGPYARRLPGIEKEKGNFLKIMEISDAPGLRALSELITAPRKISWKDYAEEIPPMKGLFLGQTTNWGYIEFAPFPYYRFRWYLLGFPEAGWQAVITDSGIEDGYLRFKVKLTKDGKSPIVRTFQIGPYRRMIISRKGHKTEVHSILSIEKVMRLAGLEDYVAANRAVVDHDGSLTVASREAHPGIAVDLQELIKTIGVIISEMSEDDRGIATRIVDEMDDKEIASECGCLVERVQEVRAALQRRLRTFAAGTGFAAPDAPNPSPEAPAQSDKPNQVRNGRLLAEDGASIATKPIEQNTLVSDHGYVGIFDASSIAGPAAPVEGKRAGAATEENYVERADPASYVKAPDADSSTGYYPGMAEIEEIEGLDDVELTAKIDGYAVSLDRNVADSVPGALRDNFIKRLDSLEEALRAYVDRYKANQCVFPFTKLTFVLCQRPPSSKYLLQIHLGQVYKEKIWVSYTSLNKPSPIITDLLRQAITQLKILTEKGFYDSYRPDLKPSHAEALAHSASSEYFKSNFSALVEFRRLTEEHKVRLDRWYVNRLKMAREDKGADPAAVTYKEYLSARHPELVTKWNTGTDRSPLLLHSISLDKIARVAEYKRLEGRSVGCIVDMLTEGIKSLNEIGVTGVGTDSFKADKVSLYGRAVALAPYRDYGWGEINVLVRGDLLPDYENGGASSEVWTSRVPPEAIVAFFVDPTAWTFNEGYWFDDLLLSAMEAARKINPAFAKPVFDKNSRRMIYDPDAVNTAVTKPVEQNVEGGWEGSLSKTGDGAQSQPAPGKEYGDWKGAILRDVLKIEAVSNPYQHISNITRGFYTDCEGIELSVREKISALAERSRREGRKAEMLVIGAGLLTGYDFLAEFHNEMPYINLTFINKERLSLPVSDLVDVVNNHWPVKYRTNPAAMGYYMKYFRRHEIVHDVTKGLLPDGKDATAAFDGIILAGSTIDYIRERTQLIATIKRALKRDGFALIRGINMVMGFEGTTREQLFRDLNREAPLPQYEYFPNWESLIIQNTYPEIPFPDFLEMQNHVTHNDGLPDIYTTRHRLPAMYVPGRAEADRIHKENLNFTPTIPEKTIVCHVVADSILPSGQRKRLERLSTEMRKEKYSEKLVYLAIGDSNDPDEFMEALEKVKTQDWIKEYEKAGYKFRFDVACHRKEIVEKMQNAGMKALAFTRDGDGDIIQIEGIMLALRALDTDSLQSLINVYKFLTGKDPAVNAKDSSELARKLEFDLPARVGVDNLGTINRIIEENIKTAA